MHQQHELTGAEERFLIDSSRPTRSADEVRTEAARLVRSHAARLGMDSMAAGVLVRAIEAL